MDGGSTLAAPLIVVEDTHGSVCNDVECSDDTELWTAEEFLLFEGTHKELLLCHENYGVSLRLNAALYCDCTACAESADHDELSTHGFQ